jgi:hypothetical protein
MSTVGAWPRRVTIAEPVIVVGGLLLALLSGLLVAYYGVLGLFALLGLLFAVVVLRWPFVGLLVLAVSITLNNLFVIQGDGGVATANRFLGMLVFGAWMVGKLLRRESVVPLLTSTLTVTATLLFGFALASTLWARWPQLALSGAIQLTQFIVLALLTFDLARSWERVDLLIKALVLGATFAALLTIEQGVVGGARRAGEGIAGDLNQTASILVTIMPAAFYLLRSQNSAPWKLLGITYVAAAVPATILTYSRMNLLVLPVLLTLLTFHTLLGRRGRVTILAGAVVTIAAALYAVPTDRLEDRLVTIVPYLQGTVATDHGGIIEPSERGYHLVLGLAIWRDQPWIGAGFRNYGPLFRDEYQFVVPGTARVYYSPRSPHSTHVGMLANLGGIGFALWMALLLGAGLIPAIRTWRHTASRPDGIPYLASQAITYAVGLQIFAYGLYADIDLGKLLWILLGLASAAWTLRKADTPHPAERFQGPPNNALATGVHGRRSNDSNG